MRFADRLVAAWYSPHLTALTAALAPLSPLYAGVAATRAILYRRQWLHAQRLPVPVVDGVSSAVRHARTLVKLQPGTARRGSFAPPPVKPNQALPQAMATLLAGAHNRVQE